MVVLWYFLPVMPVVSSHTVSVAQESQTPHQFRPTSLEDTLAVLVAFQLQASGRECLRSLPYPSSSLSNPSLQSSDKEYQAFLPVIPLHRSSQLGVDPMK